MTDLVAAVIAALVALAFSLCTLERYIMGKKRQELAWTAALFLFAIASGALALGAGDGWSGPTFRLFFLFGAIVNVPVLALGTVYLLAPQRAGDVAAIAVACFAAFSAGVIATTPFTGTLPRQSIAQASKVFPTLPGVLAGVGSGIGTVVIVLGALYSIVRVRHRRLVAANVLITVGTLVTGASGIANSVFDQMTAFAVALGLGIAIIFCGFLVATPKVATERRRDERPVGERPAVSLPG